MDATRKDLLNLLTSLQIHLPPRTKLPDTELEKRLSRALDGAQYLSRVIPCTPFDPSTYSLWDKSNQVLEAVKRHNFGEANYVYESKMKGVDNPFPLYENPFMDLRQSVMSMAKRWDDGYDTFVVRDQEDSSNIALRILEIREFDKKTPILVVIYRHDLSNAPSLESLHWMSNRVQNGTARTMLSLNATLQEQQLLLMLLKQNSERLTHSYKPKLRDSTERPFTLSFLLPVGPLGAKDMGTLNRNDGCSVCGEPAKSKCSRCSAIRYCGTVCQKQDWKTHRTTCASLKGGTWRRLTFLPAAQAIPGASAISFNRFTNVAHGEEVEAQLEKLKQGFEDTVPNTHGGAAFVVKVQLNSHAANGPSWPVLEKMAGGTLGPSLDGTNMLIYDRQRTFEVMVDAGTRDIGAFGDVADVVKQKGFQRLKVFCWALRTGDSTVDLCVDNLPEWQNW